MFKILGLDNLSGGSSNITLTLEALETPQRKEGKSVKAREQDAYCEKVSSMMEKQHP